MPKKRTADAIIPQAIKPEGKTRSLPKASPTVSLRDGLLLPVLFFATLVSYWPALEGSLLWDDVSHITKPDLQPLHGLWRIWFDLGATQQYYPLLHSAFWMEHHLWGDSVAGYHLLNVTLHVVSAYLVVRIMRRLALPGEWLAGFIFALHPVGVEAVAWISEQKSVLSGAFYLASALTYLHFDRTRRKSQYFLALALFVLALLSKTVTATLPAALLVLFWWQHGRLGWKRDVLPLLPWFALGIPAGLFTAWVERTFIGAQGPEFALTLSQRLSLSGRVIWFYASKLLWPADLTFSYPRWNLEAGVSWQYLYSVSILLLVIGLCVLARRNRGPLAAFLIFAGTLFPVLGFLNVLPFRYSFVADHFQYLASLAIIVPASSLLIVAVGKTPSSRMTSIGIPAALLMTLAILTWRQSGMYRDDETLYRETIARNPASWFAHNNLGSALFLIPGRAPEAIPEFQAALRIKPDLVEAHENMGNALAQQPGRLPEAIGEYQAALLIKPDFAEVHDNLGNALAQTPGRLPDAIAEYQAAIRINPSFAAAHSNLGNAFAQSPGRLQDAIAEFQAALRLDPNLAEVHFNLGNSWLPIPGRLPDAIAEYQAALRIRPDLAEAHLNLANALSHTPGSLPQAIAECEAALQINPGLEPAKRLLARLRAEK